MESVSQICWNIRVGTGNWKLETAGPNQEDELSPTRSLSFSPALSQSPSTSDLFEIQKCPGHPRSLKEGSYARLRKSTASWEISCLGGQNQWVREMNAWRCECGGLWFLVKETDNRALFKVVCYYFLRVPLGLFSKLRVGYKIFGRDHCQIPVGFRPIFWNYKPNTLQRTLLSTHLSHSLSLFSENKKIKNSWVCGSFTISRNILSGIPPFQNVKMRKADVVCHCKVQCERADREGTHGKWILKLCSVERWKDMHC